MNFKEGAVVRTADGEKVGTVDRIVVDPINDEVTHIVVRAGVLFAEDRVIPVESVSNATQSVVKLITTNEDLDAFPRFEETYYISPPAKRDAAAEEVHTVMPLYYYPPLGSMYPAFPAVAMPELGYVNRNIPADTVAISKGTRVLDDDGKHVGDVQEVFTDDQERVTHILISKGLIFTSEKLVPITWVDILGENTIHLNVDTDILHNLPEYHPA